MRIAPGHFGRIPSTFFPPCTEPSVTGALTATAAAPTPTTRQPSGASRRATFAAASQFAT